MVEPEHTTRPRVEQTLAQAALLLAFLTLVSRVVGLLRVRIFTSHFGAGQVLDTYYAAFRIPDFLMGLFIVGTLSVAALPVVAGYLVQKPGQASKMVANLINITSVFMLGLCGLTALFAPYLVKLIVPGFSALQQHDVIVLTRLILIAEVLLSISNLTTTALNAAKRFLWAGIGPIFYNLGLIAGVVWLYPIYGLPGLGYGVILGAFLNLACQLPELYSVGLVWQPVFRVNDSGFREVLRLYLPRLLTIDLSQVSMLLAAIFGSFLAAGSISVFHLAFDLQAVPVGVFAFAAAVSAFPHLAEQHARNNVQGYVDTLSETVLRVLFYMAPIAVLLLLLRAHVVRILYGAGRFSWADTQATLAVLGVFAFSLIGQSLVPVFSRALLARKQTLTPVLGNVFGVMTSLLISWWLVSGYGIIGVVIGYTVGVTLNALLLYAWLRLNLVQTAEGLSAVTLAEERAIRWLWQLFIGVFALACVAYSALYLVGNKVNTHTWLGLAIQAGSAAALSGLVFLGFSYSSGMQEARVLVGGLAAVLTRCGKALKLVK